MASYYLLQTRRNDPETPQEEIERLAEALIESYPKTYMAQEASKILA